MNAKKILIVEDDKVAQKLLTDTLKSAGYAVLTAQDGATAVKLCREQEPDLLTLDIELAQENPGDSWNGLGIAAWLRRLNQGKKMPAMVVISGLEPAKIIEAAASVGAYTFLAKPFTKQKLLAVIEEALQAGATRPAAAC